MMVRAAKLGALSLAQGAPGFDPPQSVKDAAINAINQGHNQYVHFTGLKELEQSVSKKLLERNKIRTDPEKNILITSGAMSAISSTMLTLLNKDDEVIVFGPRYSCYEAHTALAGGKLVVSDLKKEDFSIDWADFEGKINEKTKVLILNSPHNPTGKVLTLEELEKIAEIAKRHDLYVVSDEVYENILFEGAHISIASLEGMAERTITVNALSKTYAMTGWRVGYLAASEELCAKISKAHTHLVVCAPSVFQFAGVAALKGDQTPVEEMRIHYMKNRDLVFETLERVGLNCTKPAGSFYAFVDVSSLGLDGTEFANKLLEEAKVAVVPGDEFGAVWKDFIRISFSRNEAEVIKALERLEAFVKTINSQSL